MIVCVCHAVSDKKIKDIVADGCDDIKAFYKECAIANKCKICRKDVERAFLDALQRQ
jgi:bacterioferritin-associated ferredoxin